MLTKAWFKYLAYSMGIFMYLVLIQIYYNTARIGFKINEYSVTFMHNLDILVFFIFGIVLGIEHLYKVYSVDGKWKINIPKLLIIGGPSIIFSSINYYNWPILIGVNFFSGMGMYITKFPLLVLGYILITCICKDGYIE
ncbi:MAG: hypothetical protein ACOY35_00485 [Bacillota bacterium]